MVAYRPDGKNGSKEMTPLMSTRSVFPNGSCTAIGTCIYFLTPTTTLITPLLVHLTPTWMSNRERRELRNQEVLKAAHDSRRERQRAKKRGDPAPTPTETPGKGQCKTSRGQRNPPSGKGKRPAEPANPSFGQRQGEASC